MANLLRCGANRCINVSRTFSRNALRLEKASSETTREIGSNTYQPTSLEKRYLVWAGKYKNVNEIPPLVGRETMEKARNKFRIRASNIGIVVTIIACVAMIISGKRAAQRGESVQKANLEWHKRVKEEAETHNAK